MKLYDLESQLSHLRLKYGNIDVVACTSGPLEPDFYQAIDRLEVEDFSDDVPAEHQVEGEFCGAVILKLTQD